MTLILVYGTATGEQAIIDLHKIPLRYKTILISTRNNLTAISHSSKGDNSFLSLCYDGFKRYVNHFANN